jgi:hypothetical protein
LGEEESESLATRINCFLQQKGDERAERRCISRDFGTRKVRSRNLFADIGLPIIFWTYQWRLMVDRFWAANPRSTTLAISVDVRMEWRTSCGVDPVVHPRPDGSVTASVPNGRRLSW